MCTELATEHCKMINETVLHDNTHKLPGRAKYHGQDGPYTRMSLISTIMLESNTIEGDYDITYKDDTEDTAVIP